MPPSIPGLGSQGGFTFWLQDRIGRIGRAPRSDALQKFLAAARKRPELAGVTSPFSAAVPQVYVDVDRDKVLKQGIAARRRLPDDADVPRRAVRESVQPLRPAVARLPAGGGRGAHAARQTSGSSTCGTTTATWCRCRRCRRVKQTFGPQYTNRFNVYRAAQITGAAAPGYSSGQALDALEEVAKATLPPDMSYDWSDLSYQERKASGNAARLFALSLVVRVPDSGGALRELVAAVLGAAVGAGRRRRRVRGPADAAVRLRRLRAGRRRHADRAGGEERDPDRGVRQAAQRGGQGPGRRRRSRARSCGCGRS